MKFRNLSNSMKTKSFKTKSIIPCKCDLCQIGIGKSMHFSDGIWREHEHVFQDVYTFRDEENTLRVDFECYQNLISGKRTIKDLNYNDLMLE